MSLTKKLISAAFCALATAATVAVAPVPALADGGCVRGDSPGMVPRNAFGGDMVCVTPEVAAAVQQENATAADRVDPNGAYGPQSCQQGYVWREASTSDLVCVTPDRRVATWQENANAAVGPTGGLQAQATPAGCPQWQRTGPATLDLTSGQRLEMQWRGRTATGPFKLFIPAPLLEGIPFEGEVISAYGDEPSRSTFTILWPDFDTYDFSGQIDSAGQMTGTATNNAGQVFGFTAREKFTCAR